MKPVMDTTLFREATIDSGALAVRSSIIHRIVEPGMYRGWLYRGTAQVGTFSLDVLSGTSAVLADKNVPSQVAIDLSALDISYGGRGKGPVAPFALQTEGHVVFYVSTGLREYAVKLFRADKKKASELVFDSQKLGKGDIFIAHVMRPGRYTVQNTSGKGTADLTVEYPEKGKNHPRMEPVHVECKAGFSKSEKITVQSLQAVMFSFAQEGRITIALKEAIDRPRQPKKSSAVTTKKKAKNSGDKKKIIRTIRFFG
jgi:hypothetical protein